MPKPEEQWTPEFISVGFIAKRCGVSNTTVLRWINTRRLPAFKLPGGHFRIDRTEFARFLEKYPLPVRHARQEKPPGQSSNINDTF
ncbi:MAG: hypothetical protein A2Y92_05120 [Chloroflexi bacterium RBG_13_57_8]|nr:MAG: hypothetical protein A2Y92_05120 [Chloroflexi bacterium RBG_13_57_8]